MGLKNWNKGWKDTVTFCATQQKLIYVIGLLSATRPSDLLTQEELGKKINAKRSITAYHLDKLRQGCIVEMPAQGCYRLTAMGQKLCNRIRDQDYIIKKKYRPHNVYLIVPLIQAPKDYESLKTKFTRIEASRNKVFKISDATFTFYGKKTLTIHFIEFSSPEFDETYEIKHYLKEHYVDVILSLLEENFDMKVDRANVQIIIQHLALVDDEMARLFKRLNRSFMGTHIAIDNSTGRPELEALDDRDAIEKFQFVLSGVHKLEDELNRKAKSKENGGSKSWNSMQWSKKGE